ncbi:taurine catabolism dioxygenase TauD [Sporothrix brasiliensis 5110]|uniref:Taurine catabolism dioxygenase TauD n=1 Tax=Sporothrix brasiliensis 5110 TaxID=1398154 RepID=A0A0C2FQE6_9PEZI|nr:taurine catabolism dioxygenase TauD [Sporothrix brasiliensis 5110]KIH93273.1 taurine catabolism dioxygenase TauD [Sporothrix brasiliensis 5110]
MTAVVERGPPGQPDIGYSPDFDKFEARSKRRAETEQLSPVLPEGFPKQLHSELAWDLESLTASKYDWNYVLSADDIAELHRALKHFKDLNKPLGFVSQETFPLSDLHATLRDVSREVHHGRGFKVIRGIPVEEHSLEENVILFAGISAHVAPVRGRQDSQFDGKPADVVLAHIKDLTATVDAASIGAPAYTTEKQVFHTDAGDVIALFALQESDHGGESYLSSSYRVYNELAKTRPDLIKTLAEPWAFDSFGKTEAKYVLRPLLHRVPDDSDRLVIQYARRAFTGYWGLPRSSDIPAITEAQAEALDAVHYTAERNAVALHFRRGDIQFANNLSIFHARGAFTDSPEKQRHLLRLWLRDPENAWPTAAALQDRWDKLYDGVTPENSVFPLVPTVRSASKGTQKDAATETATT